MNKEALQTMMRNAGLSVEEFDSLRQSMLMMLPAMAKKELVENINIDAFLIMLHSLHDSFGEMIKHIEENAEKIKSGLAANKARRLANEHRGSDSGQGRIEGNLSQESKTDQWGDPGI